MDTKAINTGVIQKEVPKQAVPDNMEIKKEVMFFKGNKGNIVRIGGTITRKKKKVKRNEICTCGSGKKYKKCCGKWEDN